MRAADHLVDMGPGAGEHGGARRRRRDRPTSWSRFRARSPGSSSRGSGRSPCRSAASSDRGAFSGARRAHAQPQGHRRRDSRSASSSASPGVSGSGKSTLVNEIVYKALANRLNRIRVEAGRARRASRGSSCFDKVIDIDQSPIGRTPRSNPATYTKLFDHIRELYAQTPDAKVRGYRPGRFSFNVGAAAARRARATGRSRSRCTSCPTSTCRARPATGRRYNRETLEVRFKGKNIADVLAMSVEEALEFFSKIPKIRAGCRRCTTSGSTTSSSASRRRRSPAARRSG